MVLALLAVAVDVTAMETANPVSVRQSVNSCTVQTAHYRMAVGEYGDSLAQMLDPDGEHPCAHIGPLWLEEGGITYTSFLSSTNAPRPHFHPLRSGPYLAELHIEQIELRSGADVWPGLGELSLYCHADRVFIVAAFLRPDGKWVNRGLYVYPSPERHQSGTEVAPTRYGLRISTTKSVDLEATVPAGSEEEQVGGFVSRFVQAEGAPWKPGEVREVGLCLRPAIAPDAPGAADGEPPANERWEMKMGEALGYDRATGLFRIRAQTSGTPEPPRGLRAGARLVVHNDDRRRTFLVDQLDPWGGISGGILRDGAGLPIPMLLQFGLNFPELHAEAREPGWASLTYPVTLAPNETREIRAEHLYHALSDRECMYLTSLDNIGDPLLLQTTVGRSESHTLTTSAYPGALQPGNELRVNDFRRIYSRIVKRSVSAILPTFFGYYDDADRYQGLMPGFVQFRETGPFLTEYTVEAATVDGSVAGSLRVWQAPHADLTRLFTDVDLQVNRTVRLSGTRPAPLFFLRHHAFNPMAFMRYAFAAADGTTRAGELTYARTIVENGTPTVPLPFACLYRASNGIDDGIPCSDITGNPGFVVLAWDVTIGARKVSPGAYVFCTGADDPEGAYARDIALVPAEPVQELPAGSRIRYRALQVVYGDNSTDHSPMEDEREHWQRRPLTLRAAVGTVLAADPPEVAAVEGRIDAEVSGGTDWLPVRLVGFDPDRALHVRQTDAGGSRMLGPGTPDEPWYSAWPAGADRCGFTLLVRTDPGGGPLRLEAWQ